MGQRILVVEDEEAIRLFISDVLKERGFEVFEADSAEAALSVLSAPKDIAVLVVDVELAGRMSGLELVQRARDFFPHIRSIIVSGKTTSVDACNASANGFLPKPFTGEMLGEIVTLSCAHFSQ